MLQKRLFVFCILIIALISFSLSYKSSKSHSSKANLNNEESSEIQGTFGYQVKKISDERDTVYTQGLILSDDGKHLYESGGLYNKSSLKKLSYPSLAIESEQKLDDKYFGEGIAMCGNVLYQLTWRENDVLKYNADDLTPLGKIQLDENMKEGWGLTEFSEEILLGTDGTANIYFLKCKENLKMKKRISASYQGTLLDRLNDLVFVNGYIYANRYYDSFIYKINPISGIAEHRWDMRPLVRNELQKGVLKMDGLQNGNVLNGIAYDKHRKVFILTGKLWGFFYEVKLDEDKSIEEI